MNGVLFLFLRGGDSVRDRVARVPHERPSNYPSNYKYPRFNSFCPCAFPRLTCIMVYIYIYIYLYNRYICVHIIILSLSYSLSLLETNLPRSQVRTHARTQARMHAHTVTYLFYTQFDISRSLKIVAS